MVGGAVCGSLFCKIDELISKSIDKGGTVPSFNPTRCLPLGLQRAQYLLFKAKSGSCKILIYSFRGFLFIVVMEISIFTKCKPR